MASSSASSSCKWDGGREEKVNSEIRQQMERHIEAILLKARPHAPSSIKSRIPALARRLETKLYTLAENSVEYSNRFTLQARLKKLMREGPGSSNRFGKRQRPIFKSSNDDLQALTKRPMFNSVSQSRDTTVDIVGQNGRISFHFSNTAPPEDIDDDDLESSDEELEAEEGATSTVDASKGKEVPIREFYSLCHRAVLYGQDNQETFTKLAALYVGFPHLQKDFQQGLAEAITICIDFDATEHAEEQVDIPFEDFDQNDVAMMQQKRQSETKQEPQSEGALSRLLSFCADVCAKSTVDPRLLHTMLRLYTGRLSKKPPGFEHQLPEFDPQALRRCIDHLVLAVPELSCSVVKMLLKCWPRNNSDQQMLFLMQLESVVRLNIQHIIGYLQHIIHRLISTCINGNVHVSCFSMNLAHNLVQVFKGKRLQGDLESTRQGFIKMKAKLLENRSSFWHPEMRKRVDNLVAELQGVG